MWWYGLHALLEVLQKLPELSNHMLAFVRWAYSTTASVYRSVPAFVNIWDEFLGELGRYAITVEVRTRRLVYLYQVLV